MYLPIILQIFGLKLHKNERIWTPGGVPLRFATESQSIRLTVVFSGGRVFCQRKIWEWKPITTGRNEVVAKVIFLHLFVIPFTGGGVSASVHAGIPHPSGSRHTPRGADIPQEQTPPKSRHPTRSRHLPPEKQTLAYGQ